MTSKIELFNISKLFQKKRRALNDKDYNDNHFLLQLSCDDLYDKFCDLTKKVDNSIIFNFSEDKLARQLEQHPRIKNLKKYSFLGVEYNESPDIGHIFTENNRLYDAIFSNLFLHWINDLPGYLVQARKSLNPDGLFMGSCVGGESLKELRDVLYQTEMSLFKGASPRVSPMIDVRVMGDLLLRAGFKLPIVDRHKIKVRYKSFMHMIQDLRRLGETNCLNEQNPSPLTKAFIQEAETIYAKKYIDEGKLYATFELLTIVAWSPHPSQQKALLPGSGQISLTEALSTKSEKPE